MGQFSPSVSPADAQHWLARLDSEDERANRITPKHVRGLAQLLEFDGPTGCHPSLKTVADRAGIAVNTLAAARDRAIEIGMLKVMPHYQWAVVNGRKLWVRASDRYYFLIPREPIPDRKRGRKWLTGWWKRWRERRGPRLKLCAGSSTDINILPSVPGEEGSVDAASKQTGAVSSAQAELDVVEKSALPAHVKERVRAAVRDAIRDALKPAAGMKLVEIPGLTPPPGSDAALAARREAIEAQQKEAWQARETALKAKTTSAVAGTWAASAATAKAQEEARVLAHLRAQRAAVTAVKDPGSG